MTNAERALDIVRSSGAAQPFVVAQLGQSLDGRIALPSGESRYINGPAALDHLHRLRGAIDAVITGIGAVIADDPQLTVRRVKGRNPARVIIDPNGRLPAPSRCLEENGAPVFIIRRGGCKAPVPEPASPIYVDSYGRGISCKAIVHAVAERGFRRLLVEGGAYTVSRFFEEGQLDRLHILLAPVLLGDGKAGLQAKPPPRLAAAIRVSPDIYALGGGEVLIDCPLR
jgi:diaminohydroxyphosphoribosylaminopyrimidine deaminase / 5-amino-6-(5-phosphoribosylamino)uracil reductase